MNKVEMKDKVHIMLSGGGGLCTSVWLLSRLRLAVAMSY